MNDDSSNIEESLINLKITTNEIRNAPSTKTISDTLDIEPIPEEKLQDSNNSDDDEEYEYFTKMQQTRNKSEPHKYIPFKSKNNFSKADFEIMNVLGNGAYAKVVRACHTKTNEIVAMKIIDKTFMEKVSILIPFCLYIY